MPSLGAAAAELSAEAEICLSGVLSSSPPVAFSLPTSCLLLSQRLLCEIRLLRKVTHPHILGLRDIQSTASSEGFESLYITTRTPTCDLGRVIHSNTSLEEDHLQWIVYQCLCGLHYLHSAGVLHLDLKPSRLLIDAETCGVQICGFEYCVSTNETVTPNNWNDNDDDDVEDNRVVTKWYRAPEVLLCFRPGPSHNKAIDIWGVGCILGELLARKPIFPGECHIDQLKRIDQLVGSDSKDDLW